MILERDERPLHRTRLGRSLVVGFLCTLLSLGLAVRQAEPWLLAVSVLLVLGQLLAALAFRQHLLTDRSLIEYSPLLVGLARRFPRLARFEAHHRRVVPLTDVLEASRAGARLLLRPRIGPPIHFPCASEQDAADLLRSLEGLLRGRGRPYARATGSESGPPTSSVQVTTLATRQPVAGGRCPYCHDDVGPEEGAACERCGAVHHAECLDVHGGCAAFTCQGTARARVRTGW